MSRLHLLNFRWWRAALFMSEFLIRGQPAEDDYSRKVTEVHSEALLEGWLAYLAELGVLEDNSV